jgi:uncharacterized protein YjbK
MTEDMHIGTPSQTDNYLDTKKHPKKCYVRALPIRKEDNQQARALDGPNYNLRCLLLKFFLC